jgi:hypothetical protein
MKKNLLVAAALIGIPALALVLFAEPLAKQFALDALGVRTAGGCALSAATMLAVTAFVLLKVEPDKSLVAERAKAKYNAAVEVRGLIPDARDSIGQICNLVRATAPQDLPELGALSFGALSRFCASWTGTKKEHFWTKEERGMLKAANKAIFAFLLTLESEKAVDLQQLDARAVEAKATLDAINAALDLGKPDGGA